MRQAGKPPVQPFVIPEQSPALAVFEPERRRRWLRAHDP
jgi:hypothetical protein